MFIRVLPRGDEHFGHLAAACLEELQEHLGEATQVLGSQNDKRALVEVLAIMGYSLREEDFSESRRCHETAIAYANESSKFHARTARAHELYATTLRLRARPRAAELRAEIRAGIRAAEKRGDSQRAEELRAELRAGLRAKIRAAEERGDSQRAEELRAELRAEELRAELRARYALDTRCRGTRRQPTRRRATR